MLLFALTAAHALKYVQQKLFLLNKPTSHKKIEPIEISVGFFI
jgi:hypothetical protein